MTQPVIVGIDLGKNWFRLVGVDDASAAVFRKKMNRCGDCNRFILNAARFSQPTLQPPIQHLADHQNCCPSHSSVSVIGAMTCGSRFSES